MPGLDFGEEEGEDAAAMKKKRLAPNLGKFQRRRKSHSACLPSSHLNHFSCFAAKTPKRPCSQTKRRRKHVQTTPYLSAPFAADQGNEN